MKKIKTDHLTTAQKENLLFQKFNKKTYEFFAMGSKSEILAFIKKNKRLKKMSYKTVKKGGTWFLYYYFKDINAMPARSLFMCKYKKYTIDYLFDLFFLSFLSTQKP